MRSRRIPTLRIIDSSMKKFNIHRMLTKKRSRMTGCCANGLYGLVVISYGPKIRILCSKCHQDLAGSSIPRTTHRDNCAQISNTESTEEAHRTQRAKLSKKIEICLNSVAAPAISGEPTSNFSRWDRNEPIYPTSPPVRCLKIDRYNSVVF